MVLSFLKLFQQLCLESFELLGLHLVLADLMRQVAPLLLDIVASYPVLLVKELIALLVTKCLIVLDLAFSLICLQLVLLIGLCHLCKRLLLEELHAIRNRLLISLVFGGTNLEICLLLKFPLLIETSIVLLVHLAALLVHHLLLVVEVIGGHACADLGSFLTRIRDLLLSTRFLFLEHSHSVLQLEHVLLELETNGARLGIGEILAF